MKKPQMCGSCKRGCIYDVPADYAVAGYRMRYAYNPKTGRGGERKQAFRANVCADHLYCLDQDGAVITEKRKLK